MLTTYEHKAGQPRDVTTAATAAAQGEEPVVRAVTSNGLGGRNRESAADSMLKSGDLEMKAMYTPNPRLRNGSRLNSLPRQAVLPNQHGLAPHHKPSTSPRSGLHKGLVLRSPLLSNINPTETPAQLRMAKNLNLTSRPFTRDPRNSAPRAAEDIAMDSYEQ